jgi:phosphatidate cytidylyltransferase
MVNRFIAAVVGVPALLGLCWLGSGPFSVTMTVIAGIGCMELVRAQRKAGLRPNIVLACMGLFGPALPLLMGHGDQGAGIALTAILSLVIGLFLAGLVSEVMFAEGRAAITPMTNVGSGLCCAAYIALFGGLSMLRVSPGVWGKPSFAGADVGFLVVLLVLSSVWATDTAAYFVGRGIGSTPLAPALSPKKTVEGAIGGFVVAVIVGAVLGHFLLGRGLMGWWVGAVAGIAGQIGDLFESALKRELKIKDFGTIIPGHGGVLDRFDSLLFVAPAVWLLTHVLD